AAPRRGALTLRARFTALSTALLGAVLAIATVVFVRLDAADGERRLVQRARDLARPQHLPIPHEDPAPMSVPAQPDGARAAVRLYETNPRRLSLVLIGSGATSETIGEVIPERVRLAVLRAGQQ